MSSTNYKSHQLINKYTIESETNEVQPSVSFSINNQVLITNKILVVPSN